MFGIFKSKRQKIFDRYKEVIDGATLAGAALGFIKQKLDLNAQNEFIKLYDEYENATSELMDQNVREDAKAMMRELFQDAENDAGLVNSMSSEMIKGIKNELLRNTDLAKQTLNR